MDVLLTPMMRGVYSLTLDLFRIRFVDSIEDGDISLDELKHEMQTELEQIHQKINKLFIAPLKTAEVNFKFGMHQAHYGNTTESVRYFRNAEQSAIAAFTTSPNFEGKLVATRLQLLSIFLIHGYFTRSADMRLMHAMCATVFERLLDATEVKTAIRDGLSRSIFRFFVRSSKKVERFNVLSDVSELSELLTKYTKHAFPIMSVSGKPIDMLQDMSQLRHLNGHKSYVYAMVVHRGKLYSGSWDKTIKVWDLITHKLLTSFTGHTYGVNALITCKDKLYSGSWDNTIKVWSLPSGKLEHTLTGHRYGVDSLVAYEGFLYSGSWDNTIKVWDLQYHHFVCTLRSHDECVYALAAGEGKLFSGSWDKTIKIWDLRHLELVATLTGHSDFIYALLYFEGYLYSGSSDKTIKVWDLRRHGEVTTLFGHTKPVYALAIRKGKLYSGSDDKSVKVWDLRTSALVTTLNGHSGSIFSLVACGGRIFAGQANGKIRMRLL